MSKVPRMPANHRNRITFTNLLLAVVGSILVIPSIASAAEIRLAKPEREGMSSELLQRIEQVNHRWTDEGKIAGIITAVARNGKLVHQSTTGVRGADDPRPMAMDDLFRIYSMSKPIAAVAAMQLYEQGKFQLNDPVSKYLPEMKDLMVYEDGKTRPARQEMTMQQLLSYTAGLSYGGDANHPVDKLYLDAKLFAAKNLEEFVMRLAKLPLMFDPGERWHYSVAADVTGLVVERLSGQSFDEYLNVHLFEPLDMVDTSFNVPADKLHRLVPNHSFDTTTGKSVTLASGKYQNTPLASGNHQNVTLFSGGGGLVSTLRDYLRFAVAIRHGELNGVRILSPKTVAYMARNHLGATLQGGASGEQPTLDEQSRNGWGSRLNGSGFGLGFSVLVDAAASGVIGSAGTYRWGGAAGTVFWIDPVEDIVVVSMMQLMDATWRDYPAELKVATYQALLQSNEWR